MGDGQAHVFSVNIDYSALPYAENLCINMPDFAENENRVYTYSAPDFDFLEQQYITVVYEYPLDRQELETRMVPAEICIESVCAPCEEEDILCLDGNQATFSKIAEDETCFLELNLQCDMYLAILNGARCDEKTYYDYGRIKTLLVEDYDTQYGSDERLMQEKIYELEDEMYQEIDLDWLLKDVQVFGNGELGMKDIRLTILDTYEGETYPEVALSEIYFIQGDGSPVVFDDIPMKRLEESGMPQFLDVSQVVPLEETEITIEDVVEDIPKEKVYKKWVACFLVIALAMLFKGKNK